MTSRRSVLSLLAAAGASGFAIGARARAREVQAETDYPPLGRFIEVAGRRVHALTEGQGPDVVLIHGSGGNIRDFTLSLMPALVRHFRVTAFDRPGLGWSEAIPGAEDPRVQGAHLAAAADVLGLNRPVVLGQSYGGAVALGWALARRGSLAGLATVSSPTMPWPGPLDRWYRVTGSALGGATAVPLISAFAGQDQALASLTATFAPDPVPAGYLDGIGIGLALRRATLRENGRQVMALKAQLGEMSALYPGLDLPVEALHGTDDSVVDPEVHPGPMSRLLPRCRVTMIEGAGHMPHHAHPEPILAAIARLAG